MAFVAIGATMVGSITFSRKKGEYVTKGDEVCVFLYFCPFIWIPSNLVSCFNSTSVWILLIWRKHCNMCVWKGMIEWIIMEKSSKLMVCELQRDIYYLFLQDAIKLDEDLLGNSERSLETLVSMGMRLGESTRTRTQTQMPL